MEDYAGVDIHLQLIKEPTQEQDFWQELWSRGTPIMKQLVKNCRPWEVSMLEKFVQDCNPWVGTYTGTEEEYEEEGSAEVTDYELTTTPIPHQRALLGRRRYQSYELS